MHRRAQSPIAIGIASLLFASGSALCAQSPFATRVLEYKPAPGQFVNNSDFNDPTRALGAPVAGGTNAPDLTSVVSLGGFGGTIVLGFDHAIPNKPATASSPINPHGLDLIVFGNSFYASGNPNRRFAECAVIEVSRDANNNGLADDPWYLIAGSHLRTDATPAAVFPLFPIIATWDTDTTDPTYPPTSAAAVPAWAIVPPPPPPQPPITVFFTSGYQLPAIFSALVLANPLGSGATTEGIYGYGDYTPTLILGDLDADNISDDPQMSAEQFYTQPDDPFVVGITPGSGGGDAIDLSWAIDSATGQPLSPPLESIHFIRITTAINVLSGAFGELSSEIDAVAAAFAPVFAHSDFNRNGEVTADDIFAFLDAWFAQTGQSGTGLSADIDGGGTVSADDIFAFLDLWFARA